MKMPQKKGESRKRMSELYQRISTEVDKFCEEQDYDVTYAEIFNVFFKILRNFSGQLLEDEWKDD